MAATTLHIPVLVQPVTIDGRREYNVRPLFLDFLSITHRRYPDALSQLKGEIKRGFAHFTFGRSTADQLLWFKFNPEVKLSHYKFDFNLGSNYIKGVFAAGSFSFGENTYALLPHFGNFMYMVPGDAKIREHTEKVILQLLKNYKKSEGDNFEPARFLSSKREFLTYLTQDVNIREAKFGFDTAMDNDFFARFREEVSFEGGEEIEKVGYDICELYPDNLNRSFYTEEQSGQLYELVFGKENTPVVLVGKEGVGKHSLVHEIAWRFMEGKGAKMGHGNRRSLWHINPNRIIAGMSIVGYWEKRFEAILKFVQEPEGHPKQSDIIFIDNPVPLLHIGKSSQNVLTLSHVLKTWLEKRQIPLVMLATLEEWKVIQDGHRSFADLFQVIRVNEPSFSTATKIVLQQRKMLESKNDCVITVPAVNQLFNIQRNFLKNRALPGSVMKMLMQIAAKYRYSKVDAPEVREEFKAFSGLEERIFDEQVKLEAERLHEALAFELVGQPAAVKALAETVHLIKAKLTDRNKPLSSFLFIGPTGVGKTHAARLLCKILLGNDDHILRFDMNEYNDGTALERLIGNAFNPEGQLTGKVRYQPFSVVLLDEIEKADTAVHDLLLQVLDDARLTDSLGRTVDFSNTVIIMTSNLGARESASQLGFTAGTRDNSEVFRKAVEKFFRPEFVNRIEEIIIFNPLSFDEIQRIAQLQIKELLQRDGFVRRTTIVNVDSEALNWVAKRGYDEKMGGRALKRQIERDLTLLSAEQLIRTTTEAPIILDISLENDSLVPRITPLEFYHTRDEYWMPEIPNEAGAGRFLYKLLKTIEGIERKISAFERRQKKQSHLVDVGEEKPDWQHYDFKNKVAEAKENLQFKRLKLKDHHIQSTPALPLRIKRSSFVQRHSEATRGWREKQKDRFFQQEALQELREEYRNLTPLFDSFQTDYLNSYLEVVFLQLFIEGFLTEKTDKIRLQFTSCVNNSGKEEIEGLLGLYDRLFKKMDIQYKLIPDEKAIEAEGFNLLQLLAGEEGIHLFYIAHQVPVPVRLSIFSEGTASSKPHKVIRIYDGETITDLRTGYSNAINLTPAEFKLLLYAGLPPEYHI